MHDLVSPTRIHYLMVILLTLTITAGHLWQGHTHMWASAIIIVAYIVITDRLLRLQKKAIEKLQEFHTVCAWCRKVHYKDRYITIEEFLNDAYDTKTSHGICEDCKDNIMRDMSLQAGVHRRPQVGM